MIKKCIAAAFFAIFILFLLKAGGFEKNPAADQKAKGGASLSFQVDANAPPRKVSRLGIDLGRWSTEGTLQYSTNILMNPGFEGLIERTIVIVSEFTQNSFSDEVGLGYPDNYWNEAEFDIRSGKSAGIKGVIKSSLNSGSHGLPQYFSQNPLPHLEANDVIVITKIHRLGAVANWWINDPSVVQLDPYRYNPESPGSQSVKLTPSKSTPAEIRFYTDTIAERSGNMLLVNGPWVFSFFAKAEKPDARLEATFKRVGEKAPFFHDRITLTNEWKQYTIEFQGKDQGMPNPLELSLSSQSPNPAIWIDDLALSPKQGDNFPFRKEVVDALQLLKPSFLREFPPLGDTFGNHIAPISMRKSWAERRDGGPTQHIFNYSLPNFIELCRKIQANPWIIVPPVFSDYECEELGLYLKEHASKETFSEVILEFGADNWNWLYRPLAIPYPKEYGGVADRGFDIISKAAGKQVNLRFLVNGQYSYSEDFLAWIKHSKKADGMAIAPYFFKTLNKATPDNVQLETLFNEDSNLMELISDQLFSKGKSLAISEINLGTTEGDAKGYERNRIVAGAASGPALARKVIESLFSGADPVLVQSLGQYDTPDWDIEGFVDLWGIVRDFGPPLRMRPTGLATEILNQVIQGDLYPLKSQNPPSKEINALTLAAFKSKRGWTAAIVSGHHKELEVEIHFPDDGASLPTVLLALESKDPFATNEESEKITIRQETLEPAKERSVKISVPPWGLIALSQAPL